MNKMMLMTAGPTQVRENVRMARSRVTTNPDEDIALGIDAMGAIQLEYNIISAI